MAGRSVGTIEVTVDANTKQLRATLLADSNSIGRQAHKVLEKHLSGIQADIDLQEQEAIQRTKVLRKRVEAELRGIPIDLEVEIENAWEEIKKLEAQIKKADPTLKVGIELIKSNQEKIDAYQAMIEQMEADINVGASTVEALREADALERDIEQREANIKAFIDPDLKAWKAETERIENEKLQVEVHLEAVTAKFKAEMEKSVRDQEVKIKADLDTMEATAKAKSWREFQKLRKVELELDIDRSQWEAIKAKMAADAEKAGEESGDKGGKAFWKKFVSGDNTVILVEAVIGLGSELAGALQGLMSAATSIVSSAVYAMGGAIGALTPIIAGMGFAAGGAVVGFLGFGDAMKAVNTEMADSIAQGRPFNAHAQAIEDSMIGLSSSARGAAMAFAEVRPEMDALQRGIQEELFKDFDKLIQQSAKTTLPNFSAALRGGAESANTFALALGDIASNTDFKGMWDAVKPAVDKVFAAIALVIDSFEPFIKAAAPAADRLAGFLLVAANNMRTFVSNNPQAIKDFLDAGVESLKLWGGLLVEVGKALGTIFKAGKAEGDGFVGTLREIVGNFNDWMSTVEGQTALTNFFESGLSAMEALKPVLDGLKAAFDVLMEGGADERFAMFAEQIGNALPVLAELINILGEIGIFNALLEVIIQIGEALEPVIPSIMTLASAIGDMLFAAIEALIPVLQLAATGIGFLAELITPLVAGLAAIPAPILLGAAAVIALAAGIAILTISFGGVTAAIELATIAMGVFVLSNPVLVAVAAAVLAVAAAAAILTGQFGSGAKKAKEMEERTADVTASLDDQVDTMLRAVAAGEDATDAMTLLSNSLLTTDKDGNKLKESMQSLGLQFDDTAQTLIDMQNDPVTALKRIGEEAGLTSEQALKLANAVEGSDTSFTVLTTAMNTLGGEANLTKEQIANLAMNMEELQDQQEKLDMDEQIRGFIEQQAALGLNNEAMADAATKGKDLADMTSNELLVAYQDFTGALAANAEAGGTAAETAAQIEAGLIKEAEAAAQAQAESDAMADAMRNLARETAIAESGFPAAAEKVADLADKLRDGGEAADTLKDAFDSLVSPFLDQQAAFDQMAENALKLEENLKKAAEGEEGFSNSLDTTTQAGLDNRAAFRDSVQGITDWAAAQIAAGESSEETENAVLSQRNALIDQAMAFGLSREDAIAYINALGLTPEVITTLIDNPGMTDALLNSEDLNVEFDELGQPVITDFKQPGLEAGITDTEALNKEIGKVPGKTTGVIDINAPEQTGNVEKTQGALEKVDVTNPSPEITLPTHSKVMTDLKSLQTALDKIDNTAPNPSITLPTFTKVKTDLETVQTLLDGIDTTKAKPGVELPTFKGVTGDLDTLQTKLSNLSDESINITLPGINSRIAEVDHLKRSIDNLYSKTVTITTRNVTQNVGGNMTGGIISSPQITAVGERGYSEAIIPLQLPMNRIDPSVRGMAEVLRGGGGGGNPVVGAGVTHNHTWNINEVGDARTTAHKVINRMVAFV